MSATSPQLVVLDIKWRKYGKATDPGLEQPLLADLLPAKKSKSKSGAKRASARASGKDGAAGDDGGIIAELGATPVDLRLSVLMEHIKNAVIRVLVLVRHNMDCSPTRWA